MRTAMAILCEFPRGDYLELEVVDEVGEERGIPAGVCNESEETDGGRRRGGGGAGDAADETEQFPQVGQDNRGEGEGREEEGSGGVG